MEERIQKLKKDREETIGKMANSPSLMMMMIGQIDDDIREAEDAVDNFQWAKNMGR